MRRILAAAALLAVVTCSSAAWAAGGAPEAPGEKTLFLWPKEPRTWTVVRGGAVGVLAYSEEAKSFRFSGRALRPDTPYALVRYAEAPPAVDLLAQGRTGSGGDLRLSGTWPDWTQKFWLVLGGDVQVTASGRARLVGWHPESYLFEEKVLGLTCDCDEEATAGKAR